MTTPRLRRVAAAGGRVWVTRHHHPVPGSHPPAGGGPALLRSGGLDGDLRIKELLTNLPAGTIGLLIVVNLVIFVLGFFIDFLNGRLQG